MKQKGLGRGLDAIFGSDPVDAKLKPMSQMAEIEIADIIPNPTQPRTQFDEEALDELADSIRQLGVIQPVTVKKGDGGKYVIISGERRWRAAQRADLKTLPAYIREVDDENLHAMALVENIQRQDLNAIEIALGMQRLIDDYITPMMGQPNPDFGPMGRAVLGVAAVYILGAFSAWLYNYLMIFVSQGTLKNLRVKLFSKMERLPIKYFDTHAHGDIMSVYTNDIDTMRQMISQSMPQLISSVITIVSIVVSMVMLNVPLLIITLFMVAATMTLSMKRIKNSGRFFVQQQMDLGKVNGYICQGFNPVASFPNKNKVVASLSKLKFLVTIDPLNTETSTFWQNHGESNDVDPSKIQTEVFRLPSTCFAEEDGSIANSGRWLQWHWKGQDAPGEARNDGEILAGIYHRLREMYRAAAEDGVALQAAGSSGIRRGREREQRLRAGGSLRQQRRSAGEKRPAVEQLRAVAR